MTIRNDATRLRIATKEKRRLRAVVPRQGQVLLDTDVEQDSRLQLERIEQETRDTLGSPGRLLVPAGTDGFKITSDATNNPTIGAGNGYLGGWLLENADVCRMFTPPPQGGVTQPHPRSSASLAPTTVVGIKALVRHVDPAEEPVLADVALGDAQSSGRSLVDWQVFPLTLPGAPATCSAVADDATWKALAAPSTGTLQVIEKVAPASTDPCTLTPGGGYTRLENLLYRIEVHDGVADAALPNVDGPRFKLNGLKLKISRRNASVMVRIIKPPDGVTIQVEPPALDPRNWFAPGLFAEIVSIHDDVDPRAALQSQRLFPVALATNDLITLQAQPADVTATGVADDGTWFLRLWDTFPDAVSPGIATVSAPNNATVSAEIDLGDGLSIKLGKAPTAASATFRRGDHWTFAARADGSIDWPKVGANPAAMTPEGPETRYAPLKLFTASANPADDCRVPFGSLSDQLLLYRGGDGQSAYPDPSLAKVPLAAKLRVAATVGDSPLVGATVRWSCALPAGQKSLINGTDCFTNNPVNVQTDQDGLAEVIWEIDRASMLDKYQVEAALVVGVAVTKPPIVFTARFDVAERVGYTPPDDACAPYDAVRNVDAALDELIGFACNPPKGEGGLGCCHTVGQVGEDKAEFGSIAEAIKGLRDRGHEEICLCLLPGTYPLSPQELEEILSLLDKDVLELEIGGNAATIIVESPLRFTLQRRITLRDVHLVSKDPRALEFQAKGPMDVTLAGLTVSTESTVQDGALIEFALCSVVRVSACQLVAAPERPEIRDLFPGKYYELVDASKNMNAEAVRTELGVLTDVGESKRKSMIRAFENAVETHRTSIEPDELSLLERSIAPIRKGTAPSSAAVVKLVKDWQVITGIFSQRTWSTAISFTALAEPNAEEGRNETDAVIEGCRITGGIAIGPGSRDTGLEQEVEEIMRSNDLPDAFGRLRIDATVLSWVAYGSDALGKVNGATGMDGLTGFVFDEAKFTSNTFTGAPHVHAASKATVHGNIFEAASDARVGVFVSDSVSGTGNIGPEGWDSSAQLVLHSDSGAATEAANSRLVIVT
jgi:hypothetical protein